MGSSASALLTRYGGAGVRVAPGKERGHKAVEVRLKHTRAGACQSRFEGCQRCTSDAKVSVTHAVQEHRSQPVRVGSNVSLSTRPRLTHCGCQRLEQPNTVAPRDASLGQPGQQLQHGGTDWRRRGAEQVLASRCGVWPRAWVADVCGVHGRMLMGPHSRARAQPARVTYQRPLRCCTLGTQLQPSATLLSAAPRQQAPGAARAARCHLRLGAGPQQKRCCCAPVLLALHHLPSLRLPPAARLQHAHATPRRPWSGVPRCAHARLPAAGLPRHRCLPRPAREPLDLAALRAPWRTPSVVQELHGWRAGSR